MVSFFSSLHQAVEQHIAKHWPTCNKSNGKIKKIVVFLKGKLNPKSRGDTGVGNKFTTIAMNKQGKNTIKYGIKYEESAERECEYLR